MQGTTHHDLDMFSIIRAVTSRTEPFHSQFLSRLVQYDITHGNSTFLTRLISTFVQGPAFCGSLLAELKDAQPEVKAEDPLASGERIDISIIFDSFVLGIEVKTVDSSTTPGQLNSYYSGLQKKYPGREIHLLYLTPFSSDNIPDGFTDTHIHAIREFKSFQSGNRNCSHINWSQVAGLYEGIGYSDAGVNFLLSQHTAFIRNHICDQNLFKRCALDRGFSDFIGEETLMAFFDMADKTAIVYDDSDEKYFTFHLNKNGANHDELIDALLILLTSDNFNKNAVKKNDIETSLIEKYESGPNGDFFRAFFRRISQFSYVWLKGGGRIGVRAAHPGYKSSGVSIVTLDHDQVSIIKKR